MTAPAAVQADGIVAREHYGACDGACRHPNRPALTGVAVVVCTRNRPELLQGFLDSLALQRPMPEQLVIADSSTNDQSQQVLERHPARDRLARCVTYIRVGQALAGLTRQRRVALAAVRSDLLASFDDDIVLREGCLAALERPMRDHQELAGVGASIDNCAARLSLRWRLRRLLFVVPSLAPGRYFRSGVSTPWRYMEPAQALVAGDWLPGGAVIWRTAPVRALGYAEPLDGYGAGEDLEFSLRMAQHGPLALSREARLLHLQSGEGRPDPRRLGYELLRNRIYIRDVTARWQGSNRPWFVYAMIVETLIESLDLFRPALTRRTAAYLLGVFDCVRERLGRRSRPASVLKGTAG
jgi:GT2 family glycosyltransferase